MNVYSTGDDQRVEFAITGTGAALRGLATALESVTDVTVMASEQKPSSIYAGVLIGVKFVPDETVAYGIDVSLQGRGLVIRGSKAAFKTVAEGLRSGFEADTKAGTFMQAQMLDKKRFVIPQTTSMIFLCQDISEN